MKQKLIDIEEEKNKSGMGDAFLDEEVEDQDKTNVVNEQDLRKENSADLHAVLKKKIDGIQDEMGKFARNINNYVKSCDSEIVTIVDCLKKKN